MAAESRWNSHRSLPGERTMPNQAPENHPDGFGRWVPCSGGRRVRCGLVRLSSDGPQPAGLVQFGDALVLLVELRASPGEGRGSTRLTVELWRGERRRDVWQQSIPGGLATVAL